MAANVKNLFIINPRSFWKAGKMDRIITGIQNYFKDSGAGDYDIVISQFPRDAIGIIRYHKEKIPEEITLRVYAVGGDGILFDCLNGIMGLSNVELGAMPYGRTNNFIRGFGKKNEYLFRDLSLLCKADTVPLDVIYTGNNYALEHCILGTEADAVRQSIVIREKTEKSGSINRWLSRFLYILFYFIGGVSACLNKKLQCQHYKITVDGEPFEGLFQAINIANGYFYGGIMHPMNEALPNDGILDILITQSRSMLHTYCILPFYMTGNYKKVARDFIHKRGTKITIESDYPLVICLDDKIFFDTELNVELLPSAVKFIDPTKKGYLGALANG